MVSGVLLYLPSFLSPSAHSSAYFNVFFWSQSFCEYRISGSTGQQRTKWGQLFSRASIRCHVDRPRDVRGVIHDIRTWI